MIPYGDIAGQNIPVIRSVDLLVVGGGTAGAVAAIAGAREKIRTLVVEQFGHLGGSQTGALVTPMMPNHIGQIPLNGGIDAEINTLLVAEGESGVWRDGNAGWFNPEMLKGTLERMAIGAGAELLYYSMVEDVVLDGSAVRGIVIANKAGRSAILAKRTIDCTGDADVAYRAGVPCESGHPSTGRNQPFSVRFHLGNVDLGRFGSFLKEFPRYDVLSEAKGSHVPLIHTAMVWGKGWPLEPIFRKGVDDGVLQESDGDYFQVFSIAGRPGELSFNCPRIRDDVNGTDPFHLTGAQVKGRAIIERYLRFARSYLAGCEDAYVVLAAPMVGVRESRRIRGEYYLTVEDVLGARKFEDAICRNNYPLDIHRDPKEDKGMVQRLPEGEYHEIPYRCLIPLERDDLLVAGRCLSASFEAQSSVRIQSNCRAMGEAAAVACAESLRRNIAPRALDGRTVRALLRERGGSLS